MTLLAARVPYVGAVALHHWFAIDRSGHESRWEVWQSKQAGGTSWGHLHLDLMPARVWPHKDDPQFLQQWVGQQAATLADRIESSPHDYPWCQQYRYWPGPNSNTYVQWVLRDHLKLGWRAAGKAYVALA